MEQRAHEKDHAHAEREPQIGELEPPEPDPIERLASTVGNKAFGTLARQGSGILPDGRVHPDVEMAIGRAKGGGQSLDPRVGRAVGEHVGDDYGDVRVHTGGEADQLARAVSAKAFTTGSDLFFGSGQYQPGTSSGDELIAHELTHVSQQRGAPQSGPLTVTQPGDAMEREADKVAGELG